MKEIELALSALKDGKLIIVADDENRENEGDFICSAQTVTPEQINFMATYGKGLICMPMSQSLAKKLDFAPMVEHNTDNHETAFTVSIDHIQTTTGISAHERSLTARMCCSPNAIPSDFRRPGHMFPLVAKDGGVLFRNGHTEATVDLMKLCGLTECGICCEIMDEDGSMMRGERLKDFSKKWNIPFITIKQLQQYRLEKEQPILLSSITKLPTKYGDFNSYCFIDTKTNEHHIALVKGELSQSEPILCRLHSECLTGDVFGSCRCDCGEQLEQAMKLIEQQGNGILLYLRQEGRGIGLVNKLKAYELQEQGLDTLEANLSLGFPSDMRNYKIAALMLQHLKANKIALLTNNPDKMEQLEKFGIQVTKRIPIEIKANPHDRRYLKTKKEKMGHLLAM